MSCPNCGSHRCVKFGWYKYKCAGCGERLKTLSIHPSNQFSLNTGQRVAVLRPSSSDEILVYKGWLGFCNLILDDFKQEVGEISEEDIFLKERDFVKWAKSKESKMKLPESENDASQKQFGEWLRLQKK